MLCIRMWLTWKGSKTHAVACWLWLALLCALAALCLATKGEGLTAYVLSPSCCPFNAHHSPSFLLRLMGYCWDGSRSLNSAGSWQSRI